MGTWRNIDKARPFPELRKRYWGQHLWARGYFCGTVDEQTIKQYIENQKWDEDHQGLQSSLEPAVSRRHFRQLQPQADFQPQRILPALSR